MNSGRMIDYETLAQDAMRGVVRTILSRVAKTGLPGDHHFYVSFDTQSQGTQVSKRLKDKYPEEMTIVLQHRFWDLAVHEDRFEVKLTFDGIPERLVVPFSALKVFFDPSVRYGMQFEGAEGPLDASMTSQDRKEPSLPSRSKLTAVAASSPLGQQVRSGSSRSTGERKPRTARIKATPDKPLAEPPPRAHEPVEPDASKGDPLSGDNDQTASDSDQKRASSSGGAEIVRLDAFRKK